MQPGMFGLRCFQRVSTDHKRADAELHLAAFFSRVGTNLLDKHFGFINRTAIDEIHIGQLGRDSLANVRLPAKINRRMRLPDRSRGQRNVVDLIIATFKTKMLLCP